MVSCKVRNLNFARVTRFMVDMILPEVGSYVSRKEFIYFFRKPKWIVVSYSIQSVGTRWDPCLQLGYWDILSCFFINLHIQGYYSVVKRQPFWKLPSKALTPLAVRAARAARAGDRLCHRRDETRSTRGGATSPGVKGQVDCWLKKNILWMAGRTWVHLKTLWVKSRDTSAKPKTPRQMALDWQSKNHWSASMPQGNRVKRTAQEQTTALKVPGLLQNAMGENPGVEAHNAMGTPRTARFNKWKVLELGTWKAFWCSHGQLRVGIKYRASMWTLIWPTSPVGLLQKKETFLQFDVAPKFHSYQRCCKDIRTW